MLTIDRATALRVEIPLRLTFRHALAERDRSDSVLLVVRDREGREGIGECAPRPYVTGETAGSVLDALDRLLGADGLGRGFASFDALCEALTAAGRELPRDRHAAFCALELALLDLGGKVFGCSAGDVAGPAVADRVVYSGIVSADDPAAVVTLCERLKDFGFRAVKAKVGGTAEEDRTRLELIREILGDDVSLRIDANCAWDAGTALARIRDFERFRLAAVEQPCAASALEDLAWLARRSPVPIAADESLVSLADARRLAEAGACHIFNVRISKCGGLLLSTAIREVGRSAGITPMLGAQVGETAVLAAAGRQFAARCADLRFAEGSYGSLLLEVDASDDMVLGPKGEARLQHGHGLGIAVELERLDPYVVERRELSC